MKSRFTIHDLFKQFPNDKACLEEIKRLRYPRGIYCPACQKRKPVHQFYPVKGRKSMACCCGYQVYPLAGTIFEGTRTPLKLWFYAIFVMVNTRSGVSAGQLQRELGVTYKTAWRMFKQIRELMADDNEAPLSGVVEVDETFVGGKARNTNWYYAKRAKPKDVVFGMVERDGPVKLRHVANTGKWTLLKEMRENIRPGSTIYSDDYSAYINLPQYGFKHDSVNHSAWQFRKDDCYTQNIENVWSHLKRGINGVYRSVSSKHLQSYANEFAFRYNHRHQGGRMFEILLGRVAKS